MAAVGHFGCPKFTFDRISGHFRSIPILFGFFYNMATGEHFGCSKITLDSNSCHFRSIQNLECSKITFDCISGHFWSIGHFGCPKFTFDGTDPYGSFFFFFWQNGRRWPFWMSENNFRSHFWPFQIDTQLFFFWQDGRRRPFFVYDGTTMSIIELVWYIWMINACAKFE